MTSRGIAAVRAAAALVMALTLVLVPASCGSDDGGDNATAGGDGVTTRQADDGGAQKQGTPQGPDDREIRAVFEQMRAAMATSDEKSACAAMATTMRKEFADLLGNPGRTCESGFAFYLDSGTLVEDEEPQLVRVEVDGNRAVAMARASTSRGLQRAGFVREDGDWKVGTWLRD